MELAALQIFAGATIAQKESWPEPWPNIWSPPSLVLFLTPAADKKIALGIQTSRSGCADILHAGPQPCDQAVTANHVIPVSIAAMIGAGLPISGTTKLIATSTDAATRFRPRSAAQL